MQLAEAFDQYLMACQVNGLSPKTTSWYLSVLRPFIKAYGAKSVGDISTHEIRLYIHDLMNRRSRFDGAPQRPTIEGGLSPDSIAGHIRALHAFWSWASEEYEIANPMSRIKRHKPKPHLPKGIDQNDLIRMFNATPNTPIGARDRAILCFLADTGCRIGAALNLNRKDLDLNERKAFVIEKGHILQTLHFTELTATVLTTWLALHPKLSSDAAIFCNIRTGNRLTYSGIYQSLERLKDYAGVEGRVNPHAFRHEFARVYLKNGGDLASLSLLMGHKQSTTTAMFYAIFSEDELKIMHERANPLNSIRRKLLINWL